MKLMVNRKGEALKVRLAETLDISVAGDAKEKFLQILDTALDLEIDLSALAEIDTSGVQLLMLLHQEARSRGTGCRFLHPSAGVAEVVEFYRLPGLESVPATES